MGRGGRKPLDGVNPSKAVWARLPPALYDELMAYHKRTLIPVSHLIRIAIERLVHPAGASEEYREH